MFVVFVVLFSMAKVDNAKYSALKASLGNAMGVAPIATGGNPSNPAPTMPGPDQNSVPGALAPDTTKPLVPTAAPQITVNAQAQTSTLETVPATATQTEAAKTPTAETATTTTPAKPAPDPLATVEANFEQTAAARAGQLDVSVEDRGVVVSILTSVLFPAGSAEFKPGATGILDQITNQLKSSSQSVLVEGSPDKGDQSAPWDLASKRASTVVSYLVNTHGLAPERFSVIGYGKGAGVDGIVNVVVLRRK
jgi:flagellar motor protein MotB